MHNHRRLLVWQGSKAFVSRIYDATRSFPIEERFGLAQQLRRAAMSIPSNIAEGAGRGGSAEFRRFVRIAVGSACEVETQLEIAVDLGYLAEEAYRPLAADLVGIKAKLAGLERSLAD